MRFLPFVLKHLRQYWIRTTSTVLAMVVCVFLFCTLQTIITAVSWELRSANADPRIARRPDGGLLLSREIQSLISLHHTGEGDQANVAVRGVTPLAFEVRSGVQVVEGRPFAPAAPEVIVGRRVRDRFGLGVGTKVMIRRTAWEIVGVFASDGSGFESEIWGISTRSPGPFAGRGAIRRSPSAWPIPAH